MNLRTFAAALFVCTSAPAQDPERVVDPQLHGWAMYFGDHPVSDRWGIHLEGQWRRDGAYTQWQQLLLRPGVNFQLSPAWMFTAGYGYIDTHRYGGYPVAERFPEHRFYQQAQMRNATGRVQWLHRFRLEQRLLGEMQNGVRLRWRHENRYRHMLRAAVPLRGKTITKGTWYVAAYDEFFLNFGQNVARNVFDQNRAYVALGRDLGPIGRLEAGYMNQLLQQRNGRIFESNHTLQVAMFSSFPFRKKKR